MTSVQVPGVPGQRTGSEAGFRDRLIEGLAEAIRTQGLRETTIADIVSYAKTSRRTFYELFSSKEDCYIELMRRENARISAAIASAVDPHAPWDRQIAQAVEAWIVAQASEPELNLSWIRETPLLGGEVRALEREFQEGMVDLVQALLDTEDLRAVGVTPPPRDVAVILLGGLSALFASTIEVDGDVSAIVGSCIDATVALVGLGA